MTRTAPLALAAAFVASLGATAASAQTAPRTAFDATTLELSAEGVVKTAPDIAYVTLGVTTTGPTAAAASVAERTRMAATVYALKARGIEAKDIQTSGLSLGAQYEFPQNAPRRLTGYQASNRVTIVVRSLDRTGAAIDAAVSAGATDVEGISFDIADPRPLQDEARKRAVRALGDKAQLYASATGLRIARLVTLSESSGDARPQPMMKSAMFARAAAPAADTSVEPGEVEVRASVNATYELAR
ncbi:SIMPL domain-containing protein [soil metagenome]